MDMSPEVDLNAEEDAKRTYPVLTGQAFLGLKGMRMSVKRFS